MNSQLYARKFLNARIEGVPAPKGSKKLIHGRLIEASPRLTEWNKALDAALTEQYSQHFAMEVRPVHVELTFRMPQPKAHRGQVWHVKRPDIDKLARAVLDSMTRTGVLLDDSIVASLTVRKMYASDLPTGVDVEGWLL